MKIKTQGSLIIIPASQETYKMKDMLKLVPGAKWDTVVGGWTFPAASMTASALRLMLPQAEVDEGFEALLAKRQQEEQAHQIKVSGSDNLSDYDSKTKPWKHQKTAHHFVRQRWGCNDDKSE